MNEELTFQDGSSGAMESPGARRVFRPLVQDICVRYIKVHLGDGDYDKDVWAPDFYKPSTDDEPYTPMVITVRVIIRRLNLSTKEVTRMHYLKQFC